MTERRSDRKDKEIRLLLVLVFAFGWSLASIPRPKQEHQGGQP